MPSGFESPEVTLSDREIYDVMRQMKAQALAGLPYMIGRNKTKSSWFVKDPEFIVACVRERIFKLNSIKPEDLRKLSAKELVEQGYVDPVRVFIKNEFHPIEKIKSGRFRIVCNVSLVDEIVMRLLCTKQNDSDSNNCYRGQGTAIGWDFMSGDYESARCYESVASWVEEACTNDASGWDWSVAEWCFDIDLEVRIKLNGAAPDSSFQRILRNVYICLANSVFVTSDGKMYRAKFRGIQKSGLFNTGHTNSRMRNGVAFLCGCDKSISMGDDNMSTHVDGYEEKALVYGFKLTDMRKNEPGGGFEFCSHMFYPDKCVPLNVWKGLANLLNSGANLERLEQFRDRYRHAPEIEEVERVIEKCGYLADANENLIPNHISYERYADLVACLQDE